MKRFFNIKLIFLAFVGLLITQACNKKTEGYGEDPYAGGKEQLGVVFERLNRPLPSVAPNDVFQVYVRGLMQHKEKVQVYINEEAVEVVSLTDSTMEIRVPEVVSSGGLKVRIDDQIFFGPRIPIEGNVTFDKDYAMVNGFNGSVSTILPASSGSDIWVAGYFTNFENQSSATVFRNGIHRINSLGQSVALSAGAYSPQKGYFGGINTMVATEDGKYMIGGGIYMAENLNKHRYDVNQITRINPNGSIDSMVVDVINTTPENALFGLDTVPAFNAYLTGSFSSGFGGGVSKLFAMPDSGVIAVGNFGTHNYINYDYSSRETKSRVYTNVNHIVRLKSNGRVDSTFGYNNTGANGYINGAIETSDEKIIVVGSFTSFNGQSANRIVAFDRSGEILSTFNVGTGANDEIFSISYNPTSKKIAIAGKFTTFNGQAKRGVVLLNEDGSIVSDFTFGDVEDRFPNFAQVLNNGRVLVSGNFIRYNGIHRSSLLILESNGEALQRYNNIGEFSGSIRQVVETTSSLGYPALLIGGSIFMVDGERVGNMFRLEVRD